MTEQASSRVSSVSSHPSWADRSFVFSRESDGSDNAQRLARVKQVARLMDAQFRIPGTPIRFGLDGLIGLIPGIGDTLSAATGIWIMVEAYRAGMSKPALLRMFANIFVDVIVGSIPIVGDAFDVYWKSNLRNAAILEKYLLKVTTKGTAKFS